MNPFDVVKNVAVGSAKQTVKGLGILKDVLDDVSERSSVAMPRNTLTPNLRLDPTALLTAPVKIAEKAVDTAPTAVSKLIAAIKSAGPATKNLEAAYSAERSRRAGTVSNIFSRQEGQKGFYQALGSLKGELVEPSKRAFNPVNDGLQQTDLDDLFNSVQGHPHLDVYEKVSAANGIQKLFDGRLPQPTQLSLLEDVFGKDLIIAVREKRPTIDKLKDMATEALNLPRSLVTTLDMSAMLRQGVLLGVAHPSKVPPAFKESLRQAFSQKNFEKWLTDVPNNPRYRSMKDSGLYISDPTKVSGGLGAREEKFMSNLAERIPVWGAVVRASGRAYTSYLNKLRVDSFTDLAQQFERDGIATPENLKSLASFVNHASGRGDMGVFNNAAQGLNTIFFSPRLIAARFNMLNPIWYAKQTPAVRNEAAKTMAKFIGAGSTLLTLAKAGGADVELDPRSTDFGKIRVGDTRWDVWGGFQQWVRVFSQLAAGQRKSAASGKVYNLDKKTFPFESRLDVASRFFRGKLNPSVGLALELAEGQKLFGGDLTLSSELIENTIPLYLQDISSVIDEVGPEAIFTGAVPAFFGVGLQHYGESAPSGNPFNQ